MIERKQPHHRRDDGSTGSPSPLPPGPALRNGSSFSQPGSNGPAYRSTNLNRYTTRSRLYRWHTDAFHESLWDMVVAAAPETLLDAGCGEGFVANLISHRDPDLRITGVDQSEGAIAFARRRFGDAADFRVASIFDLPFPDDHFDMVLCSEVLEHLDDPLGALRELIRVARNHVLITVPREPVFKLLNDVGQALRLCGDPGHVQFWTKQDFQEFFAPHFAETTFAWKHTYQLVLGRVE